MTASIQWHSGTLRLWLKPNPRWGDPYDWCCAIVANPEKHEMAVIIGAMGRPPKGLRREIFVQLADAGFEIAKWQRLEAQPEPLPPKEHWTSFKLAPYRTFKQ